MNAAERILDSLRTGANTGRNLATTLGIPYPTVRRAIQDLRINGYQISYPAYSEDRLYHLTEN